MDTDYVSALSDKEKAWLSKFNEEYYGNTFPKDGPKVHKTHKKSVKRELYRQTNERGRDLYNKGGKMTVIEDFFDIPSTDKAEDYVIDFLDAKRKLESGDE